MFFFENFKKALIFALVIQLSDWDLPFELMCDSSDVAIGAVLGQRRNGKSCVIQGSC